MKLALIVSLLSLGTAVGFAAWLHGTNQDLQTRLDALELHASASPAAGGTDAPSGLAGSGTQRDVAELRHLTEALVERMGSLEKSAQAGPVGSAAGAVDPAALVDMPAFGEAVRRQVLDMAANDVDFRARMGTADRTRIPKDAPFAAVAETLKLDASQEAQMSKDLQEIQGELFALLSEERPDGVVPMEIIVQAEELKQGDPRRAEHFMKLFTLKVPGGEETYMQRAVALQQAFRKKVDNYLRPRQLELLNAVEVDWFSIKFN